jgi:hypothetical protein
MWHLGSGPDGSNSLWRFINSKAKAPLHTASFDVSGKVKSDPQEVANAFAETFNARRPLNLFPFMRRNTGLDATSATQELSRLHISSIHVHNFLQDIKVHWP